MKIIILTGTHWSGKTTMFNFIFNQGFFPNGRFFKETAKKYLDLGFKLGSDKFQETIYLKEDERFYELMRLKNKANEFQKTYIYDRFVFDYIFYFDRPFDILKEVANKYLKMINPDDYTILFFKPLPSIEGKYRNHDVDYQVKIYFRLLNYYEKNFKQFHLIEDLGKEERKKKVLEIIKKN